MKTVSIWLGFIMFGKVKKWRGNLVDVDVAGVLRLVEEARDGILRRANYPKNLFG